MKYTADLHIHSNASDGQYTPTELVRMAKGHGLEVIALTDHDTVLGTDEAITAGEEIGIQVLRGVELSAKEHHNFHILGYCCDLSRPALGNLCMKQQTNRIKREQMILDFLSEKGLGLSLDEVERFAGSKVVGRPHFAQAMVQRGYVQTCREAFDKFLDTPEFWERIPQLEAPARECLRAIKDSGGKASLAHPYQMKLSDQDLDTLVTQLTDWGLDAIECYYPKYTPEQQAFYLRLAGKYGLHATGGSDFHGEQVKPDVRLARLELELDWLAEL